MEIDNSIKPTGGTTISKTRSRPLEKADASLPPSNEPSVQLSELSTQLHAPTDATFDATRVAQIKQAIAEGKFTINSDAIAGRLLASAKELVNAQRRA